MSFTDTIRKENSDFKKKLNVRKLYRSPVRDRILYLSPNEKGDLAERKPSFYVSKPIRNFFGSFGIFKDNFTFLHPSAPKIGLVDLLPKKTLKKAKKVKVPKEPKVPKKVSSSLKSKKIKELKVSKSLPKLPV